MGVPFLKPNQTQKTGILDPQKFTHDKNAIFVRLHQLFNKSISALQNLQPEISKSPKMTQNDPKIDSNPKFNKPEITTLKPEVTTKTEDISTEKLTSEDITLIIAIIIVIIVIIMVILPIILAKFAKKPKNVPYQAFTDEEDLNFPRITTNAQYFQLDSRNSEQHLIMAPKYTVNGQESAVLL